MGVLSGWEAGDHVNKTLEKSLIKDNFYHYQVV